MRIWLDGQCFQTASRDRGIGRYALEFIHALRSASPKAELSISFNAQMPSEAIVARSALNELVGSQNIHVWHGVAVAGEAASGERDWQRRLSELAIVHHVNCLNPDIALTLSPFEGQFDLAVPLLPCDELAVPAAAIFYDIIPYRFKTHYLNSEGERSYYERRLGACGRFDSLLCISKFALDEARDVLEKTRAVNISAGVSRSFESLLGKNPAPPQSIRRPYVLYVGGLDWRKNVELVPKAFAKLPRALRESHDFVLAGDHPPHILEDIHEEWTYAGLPRDAMRSLGLVSDSELVGLYKSAALVLQPSLMEGFGLTALEAMICGTPVLAARAGALPEVVGLEQFVFDPRSPEDLANKMAKVLADKGVRKTIAKQGEKQARLFNWERSARLAMDELVSVVKARRSSERRPDTSPANAGAAGAIPSLRNRLLPSIRATKPGLATAASMMTLAEPQPRSQPQLIIDATLAIERPTATGIQRVVRKICKALQDDRSCVDAVPVIAYCDGADGWYAAKSADHHDFDKTEARKLSVHSRDCIVMLDSSWHLHNEHMHFLREARLRGARVVFCLYDLVPLQSPAFCAEGMTPVFREWLLKALEVGTGFVCISKAVADELYALIEAIDYPRPIDVSYWRLGADFLAAPPSESKSKQKAGDAGTFLMVGTLEPRKGHRIAIEAFERLWSEGIDVDLVIVGKPGWGTTTLARTIREHPKFGKRLFWHQSVDDKQLVELYRNCDALIAASYSEGFGLPIVEAGHFSKPVIASDLPVFREVSSGAPAAEFFEPGNAAALAAAVKAFRRQQQDSRRKGNSRGGSKPVGAWPSWAQSARELRDVILGGKVYKTYRPKHERPFGALGNVGTLRGETRLTEKERLHELRLLEGAVEFDETHNRRISVEVLNLSKQAWFGEGMPDGRFGVRLTYHVLAEDGSMLEHDNPRSPIPLVLRPGERHHMAVTVPEQWLRWGGAYIELEMLQEGVEWWGQKLRVPLR